MASTFPLLNAPLLVLANISSFWEPQNLITISLCSKNMYRILKTYLIKTPADWQLGMIDGDIPAASAYYPETPEHVRLLIARSTSEMKTDKMKILKVGDHSVPASYEEGCVVTYWNDEKLGLSTVVDYVSTFFNMNVLSLNIVKSGLWTLDWIRSRQIEPIRRGAVIDRWSEWSEDEMTNLLRNLHPTEFLLISTSAPGKFGFTETFANSKYIRMTASWITINNIMRMTATEIVILGTGITSWDLNIFLWHWMRGGSPELEYIHVNVDDLNVFEIFDGLEEDLEEVFEERWYRRETHGVKFRFHEGVSLRNENGKTIMINFTENQFFHMAIWTDAQ